MWSSCQWYIFPFSNSDEKNSNNSRKNSKFHIFISSKLIVYAARLHFWSHWDEQKCWLKDENIWINGSRNIAFFQYCCYFMDRTQSRWHSKDSRSEFTLVRRKDCMCNHSLWSCRAPEITYCSTCLWHNFHSIHLWNSL